VVVSHAAEYGAVVSSGPTFAPSTVNWTPATPVPESATSAATRIVSATVAPPAGVVNEPLGAVVSTVQE
jgi:hypothetical protein